MDEIIESFLPEIDLISGISLGIEMLQSPALAPLILFTVGVLFLIIFLIIAVEVPVYILQRLGFIAPAHPEITNDIEDDGDPVF